MLDSADETDLKQIVITRPASGVKPKAARRPTPGMARPGKGQPLSLRGRRGPTPPPAGLATLARLWPAWAAPRSFNTGDRAARAAAQS